MTEKRREETIGEAADVAEMIKGKLLSGAIEGCDFERLRNRLFHACPSLSMAMTGQDLISQLAPEIEDPFGFPYHMAGQSSTQRKTKNGFRGGFFIAAEPIRLAAFQTFVAHTSYDYPEDLLSELSEANTPEGPMVCLSWEDARAYCQWLSQESGIYYTLPYEEEWVFAGGCMADRWPQSELPMAMREGRSKWLPPGLDNYGELRCDLDQFGPGATGMIWEWCQDKASFNGDIRNMCSGIWPNANDGHGGSSTKHHAIRHDQRVPTAGLRPMALNDACLWHTNRGTVADGKDTSPLGEYLRSVMSYGEVPGSSARPNDRPSFYFNLPVELQDRVNETLEALRAVEKFSDGATKSGAGAAIPEYGDSKHESVPGVTRVRPLKERQIDEDDFVKHAPVSTMITIDKDLLDRIHREQAEAESANQPDGKLKRLFGKFLGKR